jgi:hypothetical protein
MRKYSFLLALFLLVGCVAAQKSVTINQVVLLPEERIFTVPKGQQINVLLDGKPLTMVFPSDMKLVSPTALVRQEEKLNNAILDKTKAVQTRNKWLGIIGSIFTVLAGAFGAFWGNRKKNISVTASTK